MPKRDDDGNYMKSETGNWNVADDFSKFKIMLPLKNSEIYEDVARFGYGNFMEELINYNIPVDVLRVKGLTRLINELIKLCKNSMFSMKKTGTQNELKGYLEKLNFLMKLIPATYERKYNQVRKINFIQINERLFQDLLDKVSDIKSKINGPLNKNDLIFVSKEEFDVKSFKDKIKDRIIKRG